MPFQDDRRGTLLTATLLALAVWLVVIALRTEGRLQGLDLAAYDLLHVPATPAAANLLPLVIVRIEDDDEARFGAPLPDAVLARALARLMAQKPAALGLDLYRDSPIPDRDGLNGRPALDAVFRANPNLVATFKFGGNRPPSALEGTAQVGFADFVYDDGGILRRGFLYLDDGEQFAESLALRLAQQLLAPKGIYPAADPEYPEQLRLGDATLPPIDPPFGPYARLDARGYQYILTFPAPAEGVESLRISDVLDDAYPIDVTGKLVLVGSYTDAAKDYFFTPYSRWAEGDQRVFGVLVHGLATRQLVGMAQGQLPVPWHLPFWLENTLFLLCSLWGVCSGPLLQKPLRFALNLTLLAVCTLALPLLSWRHGLLLPLGSVTTAFLLASAASLAVTLRRAHKARQQWATLFSNRTSPALAAYCWERRAELLEGGSLRPQNLFASVLFSDLRDFTTVTESRDAAALMAWLNAYMNLMVEIVFRHGGMVDKLIGDAVMAVFGVPLPAEDEAARRAHAAAAVACAQEMARALTRFNAEWTPRGFPEAAVRIGIASGPVVAGTLGSSQRQEYTVLGDTVNIASRLESYDKHYAADTPCRILISAVTATLLQRTVPLPAVGSLHLKGKQQDVEVFQVPTGHDGG